MTPLIRETMRDFEAVGSDIELTDVHWFDMSNVVSESLAPRPRADWLKEYRPPFDKCFVVSRALKKGKLIEIYMMLHGYDPKQGIIFDVWLGDGISKPRNFPMMAYVVENDTVFCGPVEKSETVAEAEKQWALNYIALFYSSLTQRVLPAYVPSVKQGFISRKRAAKGKAPLYEWRTVVVEPVKIAKPEPKGGTHASPRLHDRRGHQRRLRSGKTVWVRSCKVGNAALGTVFHDYSVKL